MATTDTHTSPDLLQPTKLAKIIETLFLVATWLALGLYLEIFGPTLIDLKLKLNTDYEHVAVAVSGRSYGLFPGAIVGAFLVDKAGAYCHLMMALSLVVAAIVTAAVPFSPSVELLWALCFIGGVVETVINVAGQRRLLGLWKEKATAPMILLHGGYGFGSFIIPLYTDPFLAVKVPIGENITLQNLTNDQQLHASMFSNTTEYLTESRIEYSYAISASLVGLLSIVFFYYQVRELILIKQSAQQISSSDDNKHIEKNIFSGGKSFKEMINPATCAGGRFWYGTQIMVLVLFYFANAGGGERMVAGFVRSFSIDQLDFESSDASFLNTSFWISFTAGRMVFFLLARWISIRILILIETGGLALVGGLLSIFARNNQTALWVLTQPLGFFLAPMWPSGVAWTDYHVELTGVGMMVTLIGGSIGGICHLRLIGYLYENFGPQTFLYQVLGYGVLAFLLAVALDLVGAQHGARYSQTGDIQELTEKDKSDVQKEKPEVTSVM